MPLVALEDQFGGEMKRLGIRYLSLTSTPVETLEEQIEELQPLVLLSNVESLSDSDIQRKISKLKLSYIAIDEAQVFYFHSSKCTLPFLLLLLPTLLIKIIKLSEGGRP